MNNLLIGLVTVTSFFMLNITASAKHINGYQDRQIADVLKTETCKIKVLKPILFEKDSRIGKAGKVMIRAHRTNQTARRLPIGKILLVDRIELGSVIYTNDASIEGLCVIPYTTSSGCMYPSSLTISELQTESDDAISIICSDEEIIDF